MPQEKLLNHALLNHSFAQEEGEEGYWKVKTVKPLNTLPQFYDWRENFIFF